MRCLLDTNVWVEIIRGTEREKMHAVLLAKMQAHEICCCSIVKAELFAGARISRRPQENLDQLAGYLDQLVSFPFDDLAAASYAENLAIVRKVGRSIGACDLMVAAIALVNDLIVVTHDFDHFRHIPKLQLEDWQI
jgi:tRNA(fMet)-specific endonuclease VapC